MKALAYKDSGCFEEISNSRVLYSNEENVVKIPFAKPVFVPSRLITPQGTAHKTRQPQIRSNYEESHEQEYT